MSVAENPSDEQVQALIRHVVLLGDSLLRERTDVPQEPGKLEGAILPRARNPWKLTLVSSAEAAQKESSLLLPEDATHVVIYVEGNDSIAKSGLLQSEPKSYREAMLRLSVAADEFDRNVQELIRVALAWRLPAVVCTMIPPRYGDSAEQQAAFTALAIFNDRITKRAVEAHLSIIDLRLTCSEPEDYASAVMLSPAGMRKIANVIRYALFEIGSGSRRSEVFF